MYTSFTRDFADAEPPSMSVIVLSPWTLYQSAIFVRLASLRFGDKLLRRKLPSLGSLGEP